MEFKLGVSPLTNHIYAGNVRNGMWVGKKYIVTEMAVLAVAEHLLAAKEELRFSHNSGKRYALRVVELKNDEQQD